MNMLISIEIVIFLSQKFGFVNKCLMKIIRKIKSQRKVKVLVKNVPVKKLTYWWPSVYFEISDRHPVCVSIQSETLWQSITFS